MHRKIISAALIILSAILLFNNSSISEENKNLRSQGDVLVITFSGVINPVAAEYINKSINKAAAMKAEALIIKLDTPGGLDTSMRSIVKDIIRSDVPVVVYVSPSGSRAASAGTFITMAAHIAAMSPGTTIGAAHPVAVGQRMDEAVIEKAVSDAAAYIKSIAEQRGRNARWAEDAVRKSISATETEALKENVIDLVAKDINELLSAIDGKTVKTAAEDKVLNTANAKLVQHEMGFRLKVLDIISNPTIAYILMLLGFYGLFFELTSPGSIFPGVFGAICLILAFYAFQTLPVNYAGLLLIILGAILFILEAMITSYGLLTTGGIISFVLGSLMLFESPLPALQVSLSVVIPAAIITALFFIVTLKLALKAHKRKPVTGIEGIRGEEGIAKTDITPGSGGMVIVHGEYWSAYSDDVIHKGEQILVEDVKGLRVKVKKSK